MTENKRFTHKKWYNERQLFDGDEAFAIVDVYIQAEHICDKLNALHEENEKNKRIIQKQEMSFANVVNAKYRCPYCQREAFFIDFEEVQE